MTIMHGIHNIEIMEAVLYISAFIITFQTIWCQYPEGHSVGTQRYRSVGMRYLAGRFLWPTEVPLSTHLILCLRVMPNYAVVDYEGALYLRGLL